MFYGFDRRNGEKAGGRHRRDLKSHISQLSPTLCTEVETSLHRGLQHRPADWLQERRAARGTGVEARPEARVGKAKAGRGTGVLGWGQGQLAWPAQHSHSSLRTRDSQLELGRDSQISGLQLRDAMGLLTVCTCKPRLTRGGAPGRVSVCPRGVWVVGGWVCRVGGRGGSINNKSLIFYNILVFASTTSKIGCRRGRLCVGITAHTDS